MITFSENLKVGHFETWTSKPSQDFLHVTQVHGVEIASEEELPAKADGIVLKWDEFTVPIAIKTADCMPIVIEGSKGVVFLHAGWRGLADGILLRKEISNILPQKAFIGPCIHRCCFEVSQDFKTNFPRSEFFIQEGEKFFFDLTLEAKQQFRGQFPDLQIEIAPICTCCDEKFHSYRRNKTTERNWNLYIKG